MRTDTFPQKIDPPLTRSLSKEADEKNDSTVEKVKSYAKQALKGLACFGLFMGNSTWFCNGVLFSVLAPDQSKECLKKVSVFLSKQPPLTVALIALAAIAALYYAIPAGAFFAGSAIGLSMAENIAVL